MKSAALWCQFLMNFKFLQDASLAEGLNKGKFTMVNLGMMVLL